MSLKRGGTLMSLKNRPARARLLPRCALLLAALLAPVALRAQTAAAVEPLSVGVVVDASSSTRSSEVGDHMKTLLRHLSEFVKQSDPRDEFFFVGAGTAPALLADWGDPESSLRALSKIRDAKFQGATALFDACYASLERLSAARNPRRALLVFSDGLDTISLRPEKDLTALLLAGKIPVFAFGTGSPSLPAQLRGRGEEVLKRLARQSGGAAFHPRKQKDFDAAFKELSEKLRQP